MHRSGDLLTKSQDVWFESTECDKIFSQQDTLYYLSKIKDERRSESRLNVREGIYAVVDSLSPQICQVLNISSKGMAFVYFTNNKNVQFTYDRLAVVVKGRGFCLENILFEKISEYSAVLTDSFGFEKRIANIKFIDLDKTRIAEINEFIRKFLNTTLN